MIGWEQGIDIGNCSLIPNALPDNWEWKDLRMTKIRKWRAYAVKCNKSMRTDNSIKRLIVAHENVE